MEKLAVRVPEAAEMLSMCQAKVWEKVSNGEIPSIKDGKSRLIPVQGLKDWVENRAKGGE